MRSSGRKLEPGQQTGWRTVVQAQMSAVRLGDNARDREPESETVLIVHIAGRIAADEGLDHLVLVAIGNSRAVILDVDQDGLIGRVQCHDHFGTESYRVADQVRYRPIEIVGTKLRRQVVRALVSDLVAEIAELVADRLQQRRKID